MTPVKEKQKEAYKKLKETLHLKNVMQTPHLKKVVLSVGTGSFRDKKKNDIVADRLTKISGQKPASRGAKKSIASFKSRQGDLIGYQVTLRGARMYAFLDRLLNVALPRTRDFKGLSSGSVDSMGNLTVGVKEHTIFPETADEDIKDVFGIAITAVSTAHSKEDATKYFEYIGFPFKKA